jgi:hypothetical protein
MESSPVTDLGGPTEPNPAPSVLAAAAAKYGVEILGANLQEIPSAAASALADAPRAS